MSKKVWREDEIAFCKGFRLVLFYLQTSSPRRHSSIWHVKFLMSFLAEDSALLCLFKMTVNRELSGIYTTLLGESVAITHLNESQFAL